MHLYLSLPLTICCLLASYEQFARSSPLPAPALPDNHIKSRLGIMMPHSVHAMPTPATTSVCTGEDLNRWISNNINALRKALQVAVTKHGIEQTRDIVHEILGLHGVEAPIAASSNDVNVADEPVENIDAISGGLDDEAAAIAAALGQTPLHTFRSHMVSDFVHFFNLYKKQTLLDELHESVGALRLT